MTVIILKEPAVSLISDLLILKTIVPIADFLVPILAFLVVAPATETFIKSVCITYLLKTTLGSTVYVCCTVAKILPNSYRRLRMGVKFLPNSYRRIRKKFKKKEQ